MPYRFWFTEGREEFLFFFSFSRPLTVLTLFQAESLTSNLQVILKSNIERFYVWSTESTKMTRGSFKLVGKNVLLKDDFLECVLTPVFRCLCVSALGSCVMTRTTRSSRRARSSCFRCATVLMCACFVVCDGVNAAGPQCLCWVVRQLCAATLHRRSRLCVHTGPNRNPVQ